MQLQAYGIMLEYITYPRVTLTSASRLCVRHSPPGDFSRHSLTLLDPHMSPKENEPPPSWTLHQVEGALANPCHPLLAGRGIDWPLWRGKWDLVGYGGDHVALNILDCSSCNL